MPFGKFNIAYKGVEIVKVDIFREINFKIKPTILVGTNNTMIPVLVIQNDVLGTLLDGVFSPLKGIMIHFKPDLDAISAPAILALLGIDFGGIVFRSTGDDGFIEGHSSEEWLKSGWLTVDIGGGIMDHHPSEIYPGVCATSLIWEFILSQIEVEKEIKCKIQEFVDFVTIRDTKGGKENMDLAHICSLVGNDLPEEDCYLYMRNIVISYIKNETGCNTNKFIKIFSELRDYHSELNHLPSLIEKYFQKIKNGKSGPTPSVLFLDSDEIRDVLEIWLLDQKKFQNAEELLNSSTRFYLSNEKFGIFLETDNQYFLKVALKHGASMIIIKNSKGNVQIFSQKRDKMPISAIVGLLRYEEKLIAKSKMPKNLANLCVFGQANSVWYYTHEMILNGSNSNPFQTPTIIKDRKIIQICQIADSDYMPACRGGECDCVGTKCKIHFIGKHLKRCIDNKHRPQ